MEKLNFMKNEISKNHEHKHQIQHYYLNIDHFIYMHVYQTNIFAAISQ